MIEAYTAKQWLLNTLTTMNRRNPSQNHELSDRFEIWDGPTSLASVAWLPLIPIGPWFPFGSHQRSLNTCE